MELFAERYFDEVATSMAKKRLRLINFEGYNKFLIWEDAVWISSKDPSYLAPEYVEICELDCKLAAAQLDQYKMEAVHELKARYN